MSDASLTNRYPDPTRRASGRNGTGSPARAADSAGNTIRLLTSRYGPQLRHLVPVGSPSQQLAKAVAWLKQDFSQALHVDEPIARSVSVVAA